MQRIDPSLSVTAIAPPDGEAGLCLRIVGNLSGDHAHMLQQAVEPVFVSPHAPHLKLMMEDVNYMDSTGVGVVVAIIRRMNEQGGTLEIVGLSEAGRQLLEILNIASIPCVTIR